MVPDAASALIEIHIRRLNGYVGALFGIVYRVVIVRTGGRCSYRLL